MRKKINPILIHSPYIKMYFKVEDHKDLDSIPCWPEDAFAPSVD